MKFAMTVRNMHEMCDPAKYAGWWCECAHDSVQAWLENDTARYVRLM